MVKSNLYVISLFFAYVALCLEPALAEYPSSNHKVFFKEKKPHLYLALKYSEEKKYDLAKEEYSILIEAEPEHLTYRLSRGQLAILLKDYKGALADAEKVLSATNNSTEREIARLIKAQAYAGMNKTEKAIDEFTEVIKRNHHSAQAQFEFGKLLLKAKKYDRALAHLTLARSLYKDANAEFAIKNAKETDELITQIDEIQSKRKKASTKKAD